MESINDVINLIKLNMHMASKDLKDAFFSVPIYMDHQKELKFYMCGYDPAMRVFKKYLMFQFHICKNEATHQLFMWTTPTYKGLPVRHAFRIFSIPLIFLEN